MKTFQDFTNLYSLSKTLRFELKPVGNTQQMLQDNNIISLDENRKKSYDATKPYFDELHREFIQESLGNISLSGLEEYFEVYKEYKKDKKNKELQKKLDNLKKDLRKQIVKYFNIKADEWVTEKYSHLKMKKKDLSILFEEQVFQILKHNYQGESNTEVEDNATGVKTSIFDGWKGFTGYFDKFFETRRNLYKEDGTSTALATRIIDQNLDRFLDNILIFQSIKGYIDIKETEEFFKIKYEEIFSLDFYNKCILQKDIDKYNDFLGGKTLSNGEKKRGVNEIINEYRQNNPDKKLQFLKKLDKQILSEKDKFIDEIESDEKLFEVLTKLYNSAQNRIQNLKTLFDKLFKNSDEFDLSKIYIDKKVFDPYSSRWLTQDSVELFQENLKKIAKRDKITVADFIPLKYVKESLSIIPVDIRNWKDFYYISNENKTGFLSDNEPAWEQFLKVFKFEFESLFRKSIIESESGKEISTGYDVFKKEISDLLNDFKNDKESKVKIKNFADTVLHIYQMAKYFALEKKRLWDESYEIDTQFYNHAYYGFKDKFYDGAYEEIVQVYNKIRNYLTKKPYSEDKWKLKFGHSKLLQGFTESRTAKSNNGTQYGGYILRKKNEKGEYSYFIGVSKNSQLMSFFDNENGADFSEYERLNYYQIRTDSIYGTSYKGNYQDDKLNLSEEEIIKKLKNSLSGYVSRIKEINEIIDKSHRSLKDLQSDIEGIVNKYGTIFQYKRITKNQMDAAFSSKQGFYLFELYSKDFSNSKRSVSKENLHTMYLKTLLNGDQSILDLGSAEIFFRPPTKNLTKKNIITQNNIKIMKNGAPIFHKKRYSEPKIFMHLSVIFNNKAEKTKKGFLYKFNTEINNFLANNKDINIIGVDRGEKHLIYYSVINQKGESLNSGSFNVINNVNYLEKLESKAKDREQSRRDWLEVEGIKDLKKGYISQVVRKLADLAIKHNAIIVMEDLNMRFKQIRGGIEKSVYQQLEKALIEKLNFLVDKGEVDPKKAGHLLKAYQLTAPFETFKDMGKQTGIIFYTQASYTSKTDPVSGWRPNLYLKYSNAEKAKKDIMNFDDIKFNSAKKYFEFTYDVTKFSKLKEVPNKKEWTVCSCVERFRWDSKSRKYIHYKNLTDEFEKLLNEFNFDINQNIIDQISKLEIKGNEKFFRNFIYYFNLILQIRNTDSNKENNDSDFIQSPVEPFFDSRKSNHYGKQLPRNGDENGAYNIARKGIIILKKLASDNRNLYISHKEWDDFAQNIER